jgi:hypothetical protein
VFFLFTPLIFRPAPGDADTDPNHVNLRRTPEADAQGLNRLERGQYFFAAARRAAGARGLPFRWRLRTVGGAGHDSAKMSPDAAEFMADFANNEYNSSSSSNIHSFNMQKDIHGHLH